MTIKIKKLKEVSTLSENILSLITLPDLFTVVNMLLGFTAILMASQGNLSGAQILILLAVLADGVDGVLARKIEHGILGSDLDSFADLISFGVAPAGIATITIYSILPETYVINLVLAFSAAYVVSGMLRLSRYNVSSQAERFDGVPITAGGLFLATFMIIQPLLKIDFVFIVFLFGVLSILMTSQISYPKIGSLKISAPTGLLILLIVVFYYFAIDVYLYISAVLFVLLVLYLISPLVLKKGSL